MKITTVYSDSANIDAIYITPTITSKIASGATATITLTNAVITPPSVQSLDVDLLLSDSKGNAMGEETVSFSATKTAAFAELTEAYLYDVFY